MLEDLRDKIVQNGGFVNAHAHLDRANTAHEFTNEEKYKFLKEKWKLVDKIKKTSDKFDYFNRMEKALSDQLALGTSHVIMQWSACVRPRACGTYI